MAPDPVLPPLAKATCLRLPAPDLDPNRTPTGAPGATSTAAPTGAPSATSTATSTAAPTTAPNGATILTPEQSLRRAMTVVRCRMATLGGLATRFASAGGLWATILGLTLGSTTASAAEVDFGEALRRAEATSGQVQGSRLEREAGAARSQAIRGLGGPTVALSGLAARASTAFSLDTSGLAGTVNPLVGGVGAAMGLTLPTLANGYDIERTGNITSASVTALWPLYTGGRIAAARDLVGARGREAEADFIDAVGQVATQVTERYFSVELARQAVTLRAEATAGMKDHVRSATLLESKGLVARGDRLRAEVALANARQEEAKARNDLDLATVALRRQLDSPAPIETTTPLFVHTGSIGSLQSFIDTGVAHHPVWARIASKRDQADAALRLQGHRWAPTVAALGAYNKPVGGHSALGSSWVIGLQVSVPLLSSIDHDDMRRAALLEQQRVTVGADQAKRDIPTLIEAHWRTMENARLAWLAAGPAIELAEETLRLSRVGFAEAQTTVLDVTDAQLNLARARIERNRDAYDYVVALARLLEACGEPQRIVTLAADADVKLPAPAPAPAPALAPALR